MKVLIVCPFFPPSTEYRGPASVAFGHATGLRDVGVEVTVATTDLLTLVPLSRWSDLQAPPTDSVDVRRFRGRLLVPRAIAGHLRLNLMPFVVSPKLLSWVRDNLRQFDLAHIHFAREPIANLVAVIARRQGVPYVLQPHGMLARTHGARGLLDRIVISDIVRSAAGIIGLSEVELVSLRDKYPGQDIAILGNPVSEFRPLAPIRSERPTVLFLARLHPRKRADAFVRMARQLKDRGHDLRFVVAGPDGGTQRATRSLAQALGLPEIEFLGSLEPLRAREEIAQADVYVLPSIDEPYPMTVLEAMQAGTPAIVTTGCHIHPELSSARAAIVTDPDPSALADGVELALDPVARSELVAHARTWIADNASTASIGRRLADIYRSAIHVE